MSRHGRQSNIKNWPDKSVDARYKKKREEKNG